MEKANKIARGVTFIAVVTTAPGLAVPPSAHADVDPTDYFNELRGDGFLVNGNEQYLLGLAMIVCDLQDAGEADSDIGDYIARGESMPNIKARPFEIGDASHGPVRPIPPSLC